MEKYKQLRHLVHLLVGDKRRSSSVEVERFNKNPNNCYLVSFPRTGSHWLRMMLELYFERPLLTRTFYYPGRTDFLLLHTHDMELQITRQNVIYLYRNPVDTIYSQLNYYKEPIDDKYRILHWTHRYAHHLAKWAYAENFTIKKTLVRYENLKEQLVQEFSKIVAHFDGEMDESKLTFCTSQISKERVKQSTGYNQNVMTLNYEYEDRRVKFCETYASYIWENVQFVFQAFDDGKCSLDKIFPEKNIDTIMCQL